MERFNNLVNKILLNIKVNEETDEDEERIIMTLFNLTPLYIVSLCTMQLTKFCLPPWTFIHIVGPDLPQDAAHAKHTYNTSRIFCASFQ